MSKKVSASVKLRQEGNKMYVSAQKNLSSVLRRERLQNAGSLYFKAFNTGESIEEKSSAAKNLAMSSWHLAKMEEISCEKIETLFFHYKEALTYFSWSQINACDVMSRAWLDNIFTSAHSCWEEFKSGRVGELDTVVRIRILYKLVDHIKIKPVRAEVYLSIAKQHFQHGIIALEKGDYKRGLSEMRDCYMPINESKTCGEGQDCITSECRILEEDVTIHTCLADSMKSINVGDQLYQKLLFDEETLNMNMVWEVIDWYKHAAIGTREITEVEQEAIALSRIGRMYDKVLKLKYKAKEYLMRCMQLALSMHPRTFTNDEWFTECSATLKRYQDETVKQEDDVWNKKRQEILPELTDEITKLSALDKKVNQEQFLRAVYETFPPKQEKNQLDQDELSNGQYKKALQRAVIHYHPDRCDVEAHGEKWKVLSEEITKILTRRYETFK